MYLDEMRNTMAANRKMTLRELPAKSMYKLIFRISTLICKEFRLWLARDLAAEANRRIEAFGVVAGFKVVLRVQRPLTVAQTLPVGSC
jgi:hypothetical protein